jgi:hypothetical protein
MLETSNADTRNAMFAVNHYFDKSHGAFVGKPWAWALSKHGNIEQ